MIIIMIIIMILIIIILKIIIIIGKSVFKIIIFDKIF